MIEYSESILLKLAKNGDREAFKILIKQNEKKILKTAFWLFGNKEDAFDTVQDTFIYAFKNLNKFKEKSSFYTWLNWILLDMTKRKRIKEKFYKFINPFFKSKDEIDTDLEQKISNQNDNEPINILIKNEKSKKILKLIQSLEEKYSMPIILCDLDNLSYKNASNILKIPETTLKTRLFRARLKLKNLINKKFKI